jgi:hypothetical protein
VYVGALFIQAGITLPSLERANQHIPMGFVVAHDGPRVATMNV